MYSAADTSNNNISDVVHTHPHSLPTSACSLHEIHVRPYSSKVSMVSYYFMHMHLSCNKSQFLWVLITQYKTHDHEIMQATKSRK